ncbi:hypothetical protein ACSPAH_03015 [Buttiauxella agrestis]
MMRLTMILLGVDFLRSHWRGLRRFGWITLIAGIVIFIDALDGSLFFPIEPFACLLLFEGAATLMVAHSGMGGQRILRYVKGSVFSAAALLILAGQHDGDFVLAMIFGMLFLFDGALQIASAVVVRYRRWRPALWAGSSKLRWQYSSSSPGLRTIQERFPIVSASAWRLPAGICLSSPTALNAPLQIQDSKARSIWKRLMFLTSWNGMAHQPMTKKR